MHLDLSALETRVHSYYETFIYDYYDCSTVHLHSENKKIKSSELKIWTFYKLRILRARNNYIQRGKYIFF